MMNCATIVLVFMPTAGLVHLADTTGYSAVSVAYHALFHN